MLWTWDMSVIFNWNEFCMWATDSGTITTIQQVRFAFQEPGLFHPDYQGGNGNSNYFNPNQPTLRDLVYGQVKINESLQKKLAAPDKSMETIHSKMDGFSTAIKNQLSFNKIIETQLTQVAAAMPPAMENVKAITTQVGKTTQDPPYSNHVNRKKASPMAEEPPREEEPEKVHEGKTALHEF